MNNRKTTLLLLFIWANLNLCFSQQITSKVDERFELTSIAFRLAEADEYVNNSLKNYMESVDYHFSKHKNHPLITYIKQIREQHLIGYDAVSSSTTLLEIANRKVRLSPQADIPKFIKADPRWTEQTLTRYVSLLNSFYRDSKFNSFYNQHKNWYSQAEQSLDALLKNINTDWFQSFYGQPLGNPRVYIAMCNGGSNYAFFSYLKDKPSEYGVIVGCLAVDKNNIPVFDKYIIPPVIVHEYAHHFTNPLIEKHEAELRDAGDLIFPHIQKQLMQVGYGEPKTMLIEGFNNLFTNMYFKENPTGFEKYAIAENERRGFVWMKRAMSFMNNFYADRTLYSTINDFFPQLVDFMNFAADNIELIKKEYKLEPPYVMNVYPAQNSIVDASIDTIRVEFSHPMFAHKVLPTKDPKLATPKYSLRSIVSSTDSRTLLIPVSLEKKTSYGLRFFDCQSDDRFEMEEGFELKFKTK